MNQCKPNIKTFAFLAISILFGLAGNHYNLPIGYNVQFIFGSIFCILVLGTCGLNWAIPVAILTSSYTLILWNHPYAIIIFTAEILWIGLWMKKGRNNILLIDSFYWLCLGVPLVVLFYSGIMHLDVQITLVIALKQSVNGVLNALIASIFLSVEPFTRWLGREDRLQTSISQILFQIGVFFLIVPSIGLIMNANSTKQKQEETRIAETLALSIQQKTDILSHWVDTHLNAAKTIAELGNTYPLEPSTELQAQLARIHTLFPDFHSIFIADPGATTIAFDPPINERNQSTIGINFSDREWFKKLSATLEPVVSKVFIGRGGIFVPIFSISFPLLHNGEFYCFGLGSANLDRLKELVDSGRPAEDEIFYLTDEDNRIIFSNSAALKSMQTLEELTNQTYLATQVRDVSIRVPGSEKNISGMSAWREAYFVTSLQVANTGWTFHLEHPVKPLQTQLYENSISNLATIAIIFILALILATILSRALGKTHIKLVRISEDLPNKVARGEALNWPTSNVREIAFLIENFRSVAEELGNRIKEISQTNRNLEATVNERTRELSESNQQLCSILDTSPVAIAWATEDGTIEYVNRKFTSLFGYTLEDIPTVQDWYIKAYPDDIERESLVAAWEEELMTARQENRELAEFDVVVTGKDGHRHNITVVSTWTSNFLLVFFTDNTERRQMEVKTLQVARLASLGEMAAGVAHEINNPIAGIIGCAELLQKRLQGDQNKQQIIERILNESSRITRIVRSLLSTAQPGRKSIRAFSLAECFDNVETLSAAQLNRDGIDFSMDRPAESLSVAGEQQQIEQILLNMINNARFALNARFPEQSPDKKLRVSARHCDDLGSAICIDIYDQGIGIPEAIIDKIFDPFFTTKSARDGTGLGLAICYEIVRQVGGDIRVESEEGIFTRFTIKFPLVQPA